jgi:hypothetical protein
VLKKAKEEVRRWRSAMIAKREKISNAELLDEVRDWVEDLVYSWTKDTKYFIIVETVLAC